MKRPPPGFVLVATRELRWIVRDRIALFLFVGVAVITGTVLRLTFSNRHPRAQHGGRRCRPYADLAAVRAGDRGGARRPGMTVWITAAP